MPMYVLMCSFYVNVYVCPGTRHLYAYKKLYIFDGTWLISPSQGQSIYIYIYIYIVLYLAGAEASH